MSSSSQSKHPETLALHAGWRADPATGAVAVPIYQTTSYQFRDTEHAANLFALKELGNIYTRIMNPTNDVLEKRVAALEGGVCCLGARLRAGGLGVCLAEPRARRRQRRQLDRSLWRNLEFVRQYAEGSGHRGPLRRSGRSENFRRATDDRTRAYYAETLPNPKLTVFPIADVAEIGRKFGIPLIMDNTAAPILTRPFEHGAAVIVYSTTKYIGGHGNSIGGLIVDSGNFDWAAHAKRQPALNTPDPSYHGAVWTEAVKPLGPIAYIIKARVTLLRDIGSAMSPFNAFLTLQGVETVTLRMAKHCENTQAVTDFLRKRPKSRALFIRQYKPACIASGPSAISKAALAALSVSNSPAVRKPAAASSMRYRCSITSPISAMRAAWQSIPPPPRTRSSIAARTGGDRRYRRLCAPVGGHRAH